MSSQCFKNVRNGSDSPTVLGAFPECLQDVQSCSESLQVLAALIPSNHFLSNCRVLSTVSNISSLVAITILSKTLATRH